MVEVIQDRERLLPGRAGLLRIPGSAVAVTEVAEGFGRAPAAADLMVQVDCLLITGRGLGVVAQMLVGVPEGRTADTMAAYLCRESSVSHSCHLDGGS